MRSSAATIGSSATHDDRVGLDPVEPAVRRRPAARARRRSRPRSRSRGRAGARPRARAGARRPAAGRRPAPGGGGGGRRRGRGRAHVSRRAAAGTCRRPPSSTDQVVPTERRAGSRSSRVVVVTNACGSAAIRRTRCARRSGSSSENTSSSRSSGGRPSRAVSRSSSASLKARIAVRCWPREANDASGRPPISNTRSSRCGPISVVPFQTSFSAVSASRRARASRTDSPGQLRGVRRVGQLEPVRRGLVGGDLGVGGRQRARQGLQQALALGSHRAAGLQQRRVPEPQLGARRLLLADQPQQAVALLERATVGREVAEVGRRSLAGQAVERLAAQRRRARDQQHLLGGEHHGPQDAHQGRRPARDAVDPDPLAGAAGRGPDERDLDGVARTSRSVSGSPDPRLDAGQLLAPADELAVGGRAMGSAPGREDDRLEQAGLARGVRAPDELRAGREDGVEVRVAAQVADRQPEQDGCGAPALAVDLDGARRRVRGRCPEGVRQDVVRTGITTWTYASSPTGRKTPGDSGPLSSSANRSACTLPSTSLR